MSGIALVLHRRGIPVTGSDMKESRYSRALVSAGIPVHIGHDERNLGDPEVVVVSTAIPESNPELMLARAKGIEVWPRAKMLAALADDRLTVACAGTHGKTSSSSMFATMLDRMGEDPTFLIGGEVDGYDSNAASGTGRHFVVEADESDGSFMFLKPDLALITNVEADHLDHYGTLEAVEQIFIEFMSSLPADGAAVVCGDDERLVVLAHEAGVKTVTFGFSPQCDVVCTITGREGIASLAEAKFSDGITVKFKVSVPGVHMVSNAAGVLAGAWVLGLDRERAAEALSTFSGVRRRFDQVGVVGGVTVVDDYAHHPTEVAATLRAAADLDFNRVHVLFQPHRFSRTGAFSREFGRAFSAADSVTFMDVYPAGEVPIPGVTGKTLVDSVLRADPRAQVGWMPHRRDIVEYLASKARPGDLILTMGAGDVTSIGPLLIEHLEGARA